MFWKTVKAPISFVLQVSIADWEKAAGESKNLSLSGVNTWQQS